MILPPKKFEPSNDPIYDPIRHKSWFWRLEERAERIALLQQAWADYSFGCQSGEKETQSVVCERWGVNEREFRDYIHFIAGSDMLSSLEPHVKGVYQRVLDDAYQRYCANSGAKHIRFFIEKIAPMYGATGRKVADVWDVDKNFYPTNYER